MQAKIHLKSKARPFMRPLDTSFFFSFGSIQTPQQFLTILRSIREEHGIHTNASIALINLDAVESVEIGKGWKKEAGEQ